MSSGSESDEDYVPGEPEKLSEEESADEETDLQYDHEQEQKSKKRKSTDATKSNKKKRKASPIKEIETKDVDESEEIENPEEQKKKEDDLWAMFLEGTDTKPKTTLKAESKMPTEPRPKINQDDNNKKEIKTDDNEAKERRIFEFAGETIVVENDTIKEKIKSTGSPVTVSTSLVPPTSSRGRAGASRGGLSSVLGQLNKKNQLSTLEKSKLDWVTYKKEEGLEEEIESHNKGRNGYLDRRDFLERADMRQYEIERDLRMGRRSNR